MMKRMISYGVSLCLLVAVAAPSSAYEGKFSDVPPTHWAAETVEEAAGLGLMGGTGDGRFGLEESIDRAAFLTVLCRMFSWELVTPEVPSFVDCAPGDWFYSAVETALLHGAVEKTEAFRPRDAISRKDMAEMLVRALGYAPLERTVAKLASPFSDVTGNGFISIAYDMGMTNGITEGGAVTFAPEGVATREAAAAMLLRVYKRYLQKIDWLHGFYAYSSYGQIGLTQGMDEVSVAWARLDYDPLTGPFLNMTKAFGNDNAEPAGSADALGQFTANATPCNLDVYAGTGDKVTLPDGTVTNDVYAIIATPETRAQAIAALVAAVSPRFAGVTVDFEGMKDDGYHKDEFTAFMRELRAALPAEKTLYVCVPPSDWYTGFDFKALGEICDKVIMMAHDYRHTFDQSYIGTTKTDNPDSPLTRVYGALRQITDPVTGVQDRSKVALALSFANAGLQVDEEKRMVSTTNYHPATATVIKRLLQEDTERGFDAAYGTSYAYYTGDAGDHYLLWYEDALSAAAKIKLARMFGVTGISLWRIGAIPNDKTPGLNYDAWEAILKER